MDLLRLPRHTNPDFRRRRRSRKLSCYCNIRRGRKAGAWVNKQSVVDGFVTHRLGKVIEFYRDIFNLLRDN